MIENGQSESVPHSTETGWATERLLKRWKGVTFVALVFAVLAIVYTASRPARYDGHVSIFFPTKQSVLGAGGLLEAAGASSSAAALLTGGAPTPLRVYEGFLASETAVRDLARLSGLKREQFVASRQFDDDARASVLTVTYGGRDRGVILRVLKGHVDELSKINRKVSYDTSLDDLKVLNARLQNAKRNLKASEDDLVVFQKGLVSAPNVSASANGILTASPATWSSELIRVRFDLARVESQLATSRARVRMLASLPRDAAQELPPVQRRLPDLKKYEDDLAIARLTMGPQSATILRLNARVEVLRREMEEEVRNYLNGIDEGIIDPTADPREEKDGLPRLIVQKASLALQADALAKIAKVAPAEAIDLNRRFRDIALQSTVVQQLSNQLLQSKIQSQRDPNKWVVLDDPWVEEKPTNKSFTRMGLAGLLVGAVFGAFFAMLLPLRRP